MTLIFIPPARVASSVQIFGFGQPATHVKILNGCGTKYNEMHDDTVQMEHVDAGPVRQTAHLPIIFTQPRSPDLPV